MIDSQHPNNAWRGQLRHAWDWYLLVEGTDFVQRRLNRGLLMAIAAGLSLSLPALVVAFWLAVDPLVPLIIGLMVPILMLAAALTRRGGTTGAMVTMVTIAIINTITFDVETADPLWSVQVHLLLPAIIATLFVDPLSGFVAVLMQSLLLCGAMAIAGVASDAILEITFSMLLSLLIVNAPLVAASRIFRRTIARLDRLNSDLDAQVTARTAELRQVMELRERDISAVVHDIHNRMLVVRAEVDELIIDARDAGMSPAASNAAEQRINVALTAMSHLVEDLRMAAQLDNAALRLRRDLLNLGELLHRAVDGFAAQAAQTDCDLIAVIPQRLPMVTGDASKLDRVFSNLIGNALKYTRQMPEGRRRVAVAAVNEGQHIRIDVVDSGPGLDTESLSRLGQPFTRLATSRGTDGMGLGLYITKGIIELHGGRLKFESEGPGCGTAVIVWLPATSVEAADELGLLD